MSKRILCCAHCERLAASKGRGLCCTCHANRTIRARYKSERKFVRDHDTLACFSCNIRQARYAGNLCRVCHEDRTVATIPSPRLRQGVQPTEGDFYGDAPLPRRPTNALPGTPEKFAVIQHRIARKQNPVHPLDAQRSVE